MNPLVAPTIFMMAISSRRSNVVSLMVLLMMNTDTNSSMAISATEMTPATLRTVVKPLATASFTVEKNSTPAFLSTTR